MISQMEDFTLARAPSAWRAQSLRRGRHHACGMDHLMIYDAFAHLPIYGLEDWAGRGGRADSSGATPRAQRQAADEHQWRRTVPHALRHVRHVRLQESVRQVRGMAPTQVPDVELSVCHGVGGMFARQRHHHHVQPASLMRRTPS